MDEFRRIDGTLQKVLVPWDVPKLLERYRELCAQNQKNIDEINVIEHLIIDTLECPKCHFDHNIHLQLYDGSNYINCWNCHLSTSECATFEEALEEWDKIFQALHEPKKEPKDLW